MLLLAARSGNRATFEGACDAVREATKEKPSGILDMLMMTDNDGITTLQASAMSGSTDTLEVVLKAAYEVLGRDHVRIIGAPLTHDNVEVSVSSRLRFSASPIFCSLRRQRSPFGAN